MDVAERLAAEIGIQKVPSVRLSLFMRRRFLDAEECARLISLIDERRRPSTIADDLGDRYFRTSETCDLDACIPEVAALDQRIASPPDWIPGLVSQSRGNATPLARNSSRTPIISNPMARITSDIAQNPGSEPGPS